MEKETIKIELNHYRDKDYECRNSSLVFTSNINGKREGIELYGIRAEAFFRMVKDMSLMVKKEEEDGNSEETSN